MNYHDILRETGIILLWASELHDRGVYIPHSKDNTSKNRVVIARLGLDDEETEFVVLHECEHKIKGTTLTKLSSSQLHIINEAKANRFMIHCKSVDYFEEIDYQLDYFTPEHFLNRL